MPKPLKEIYTLIVETLKTTTPNTIKDMEHYRTVDYHNWNDNYFLETMAQVIFTSTLDWDIVKNKWEAIGRAFACFDVNKVAGFTENGVKQILETPNTIPNPRHVRGIIKNAKQMQEIIKEYGSFANYICFYPYDLKQDLLERFYGLGLKGEQKVVLDFMKEMGFPVIKDDKHIRRVLYRLGVTDSEDVNQEEILKIGKVIAQTMNEKACVVDCVLWTFGREVCTKRKPRCTGCKLTFCRFRSTMGSCL